MIQFLSLKKRNKKLLRKEKKKKANISMIVALKASKITSPFISNFKLLVPSLSGTNKKP